MVGPILLSVIVVLDTNVLVSALRSRLGASNAVMCRLARREFEAAVSTALLLEYDEVLHRPGIVPDYRNDEIAAFLDSVCAVSREAYIYFAWRPILPDPGDDLVLECALASGATHIVTHNLRDFPEVDRFGISVVAPNQFLRFLSP